MDYTNFIRTYYVCALHNLKKFKHYFGNFVNLVENWNIPSNFLHESENSNDFLPNEELNINAPTQYFLEYLTYLGMLMPDLEEILLNEDGIKHFYNRIMSKNLDDDTIIGQITTYIAFCCEVKKEMGVLA